MTFSLKTWLAMAIVAALVACAVSFYFLQDQSPTEVLIEGAEARREFENTLRRNNIGFKVASDGKYIIDQNIEIASDPRFLDYRKWRVRETGATTFEK